MNQSNFVKLFTILVLLSFYKRANSFGKDAGIKCRERERQALLTFRKGLVDDCGYLSSWGSGEERFDCCKWRGVHCDNRTGHVLILDLNSYEYDSECYLHPLRGNITSSLLELQHVNYLDLSFNDFGGNQIPDFIGSLTKLRFLDLSYANFSGIVPYQIGNLTNLQSLNLGYNNLHVSKLQWLSNLYKLKYLHLDSLNLKEANDWLQVISGLPSLIQLNLALSILPTINHPSLSFINSSTSLVNLDLYSSNLSNSAYHWLSKISTNLVTLDLSHNQLQGPIPDYAFCNMTSLMHLNLSGNQITGISMSFRDMCSLKTLNLDDNNLTGQLPDLFFNLSGCAKMSLQSLLLDVNMLTGSFPDVTKFSSLRQLEISYNRLDGSFPVKFGQPSPLLALNLEGNQLWGSLPDLSVFPLLRYLDIRDNRLNGTVSESLGQLSNLYSLSLSHNSLQGLITETHMSNLSKLKIIDFSYNSLALNFSPDWFPPFQLDYMALRNCKLGPYFPKWLQSQKDYSVLDISNAGILDTVPTWFWDLSPNCRYLNISYNNMEGRVPDLSQKFTLDGKIDLSSNSFEGSIPSVSPNVILLNLSKNNFSGSISCLCASNEQLGYLDLSENQLSGEIPDHCRFWRRLKILNLANNYFSGRIPTMDPNCQIISLHLRNNNLSGELPSSLQNCINLKAIDLGNNKISGTIPAWIGWRLPKMTILSLRSNHINGNLPPQLCDLTGIQVLDLSHNNIGGKIPKCFNNFTAMVQTNSSVSIMTYEIWISSFTISTIHRVGYQDQALLVWKGIESEYRSILGLVKSIDLSSNKFSGKIPDEITGLFGLLSLNLSRNSLTGPIPQNIGRLTLLNSLDLSHNHLTGKIPESFSYTTHLGVLNLSNNNLSGKIPSSTQLQTFNASTYTGNPELCGLPLNKCPGEEPPAAHQVPAIIVHESEDDGFVTRGFYISGALGFIFGFWGFCGTLVLNKKWRYAYFQFLNDVEDGLYVCIMLKMANLRRHLIS